MVILQSLFDEFCAFLDGKLRWSTQKMPRPQWTETVFSFFSEQNQKQHVPYLEQREYLRLDYIWRNDSSHYSNSDIQLVVEHENNDYVENLLDSEIQHLVDVKATNKIGIFYVNEGDESRFIGSVEKRIRAQSMRFPHEKYLVIVGRSTRQDGRLAIRYKGYFFDADGQITRQAEHVIAQAQP